MAKNFGKEERRVKEILSPGTDFTYDGVVYTVIESGKPTCGKGEPKTDIYILASYDEGTKEFKISYKKGNAEFLENKMQPERAATIFGEDWSDFVQSATASIKNAFEEKPLIYKKKYGRTDKGAFTLGWKFELLNTDNGDYSGSVQLSKDQLMEVYAGIKLPESKRNASVNGRKVVNSGVADYLLFSDNITCAQDVFDNIIPLVDYVDDYPEMYFACKALNYRSEKHKWDGNRPLSVFVDWYTENNKLCYRIVYNRPLNTKGDEVAHKLLAALEKLGIETVDDINADNLEDYRIVYE